MSEMTDPPSVERKVAFAQKKKTDIRRLLRSRWVLMLVFRVTELVIRLVDIFTRW